MIGIGLAILVVAAVLVVCGIVFEGLKILLIAGVVLVAIGAVTALVGRNRRTPLE